MKGKDSDAIVDKFISKHDLEQAFKDLNPNEYHSQDYVETVSLPKVQTNRENAHSVSERYSFLKARAKHNSSVSPIKSKLAFNVKYLMSFRKIQILLALSILNALISFSLII